MKINIETYSCYRYDEIAVEYGEVLKRFGLSKTQDGNAEIYIDCLGDLLNLNRELKQFAENVDVPIVYFGLMIKSYDDGTSYLEIKDNYD